MWVHQKYELQAHVCGRKTALPLFHPLSIGPSFQSSRSEQHACSYDISRLKGLRLRRGRQCHLVGLGIYSTWLKMF